MILNSGRHTQPDPQSCRVRSPGGRRRGPQKQTTHQETKTKLSSATPNRGKTIHCQRKHRQKHPASNVAAESAPHPRHVAKACDNNTQTIPNNGALAKIGNMQAGLENFNQQPCSPESCHSVTLARVLLLKLRHFSQKRSLQQSHFRGRKHIGFLDSKKWSSPVSRDLVQFSFLCYRRHAQCFDSVDNSFWHVFECEAVVRPLCPLANPFVGVLFGLLPLFVCLVCRFSFGRNANLAGGFAGRLAGLCVVWFVMICLQFRTFLVFVQMTF